MREILYAKVVQSSFLEEPKREEGLSPPYRQRKLLRVLMRAKSERRSSSLCRETDGRAGCSNKLIFMPLRPLRFQLHMYESSESLVQQESKSCKVHKATTKARSQEVISGLQSCKCYDRFPQCLK